MKSLFMRDPFDIAPQARRPTQASWLALAAGLLFAGLCAWPLTKSLQDMKQIEAAQRSASAELKKQAEGRRAARLRQNDPAVLERVRAQQKLLQTLRMSWGGLLDALEIAAYQVDGGVSILALVPSKTQDDAAQVGITALAANPAIMLKYIGLLQKERHVRQIELTTQQPEDKVGLEVIRFQLAVVWDPRATARPSEASDRANAAGLTGVSP